MVSCCSLVDQVDATHHYVKRYSVSLRIHSECGKIWTRITPNMATFYAVHTLIIHLNNIWTRDWDFCGWPFHSPLNSWRWLHAKTFVKSFMIRDGLLTKLSKKMLQYMFSRHSVKTRTPLGPRFSSLLSFLPKCKSNWYRYPVLVAQRYQNLNPHCIGLLFTYCLILDLLLI